MLTRKWTAVCFVLVALTATAHAWDGNRKGFVLGLGAGYGNQWLSYETESYEIDESYYYYYGVPVYVSTGKETRTDTETGWMSDFKIGYAPTNKLAIYWMSKVAWLYVSDGDQAVTSGRGDRYRKTHPAVQ